MTSIYDHSLLIPDIIHHIASQSYIVWVQIAQAVPDFGRYSMTDAGRREFARLFIQLHKKTTNNTRIIMLVCGGVIRSMYDWPNIISIKTEFQHYRASINDFINGGCTRPVDAQYWITPLSILCKENIQSVHYLTKHRDNGPAIVRSDGTLEWYQYGKLHRVDGPAVIRPRSEEWYQYDKRHRTDGPAVIRPGHLEWYQNGELHRENGPALSGDDGSEQWRLHGVLHRDDGPAVKHPNGSREWYQHGELHRIGGPAVTDSTKYECWYRYGRYHRIGGPAVTHPDGRQEWWENGIRVPYWQ